MANARRASPQPLAPRRLREHLLLEFRRSEPELLAALLVEERNAFAHAQFAHPREQRLVGITRRGDEDVREPAAPVRRHDHRAEAVGTKRVGKRTRRRKPSADERTARIVRPLVVDRATAEAAEMARLVLPAAAARTGIVATGCAHIVSSSFAASILRDCRIACTHMNGSYRRAFRVVVAFASIAAGALAQTLVGAPERGQKLYVEKMCYTCHGYAGQGGERGSGPRIAPDVWPLDAFVQQVRRPRQDMPRYPSKYLSDAELADIHAFLSTIKPGPKAKDVPLLRE